MQLPHRPKPHRSADKRTNRKRATRRAAQRKHRNLSLESLDPRMLMAADALASTHDPSLAPPLPASHGYYATEWEAIAAHEHAHENGDGHNSGHDHHCCCPSCSPGQVAHPAMETPRSDDMMFASDFDPGSPDYAAEQPSGNVGVGNEGSGSTIGSAASSDNGKWNQPGGLGQAVTVTYSYAGLLDGELSGSITTDQLRASVEEAMALWASYAPLNFVEVEDAGPPIFINGEDNTSYRSTGTPDIRIGHHDIDDNGGTLAYAYFPATNYWGVSGDIHFDTDENWRLGLGAYEETDFLEVMTHELGHALGLDHEEGVDAIMNPFHADRFSGLGTSYLLPHDIDTIRDIYGSGTGSVTPIIYNDPPVVDVIADQRLLLGTERFTIDVSATDPDGDALTFAATAVQTDAQAFRAFELKEEFGFRRSSFESFNARGHNEKYFLGEGSSWFFILPDGAIHRWSESIANSPQVAQLDASFHQQLSRLTSAQLPASSSVDVTTTWNTSELIVDINDSTLETFVIHVDVSDQYETTSQIFTVTISDNAPIITPIDDQQASVNDGLLTLTVDAVDPEGTTLDLAATASAVDEAAVAAFHLKNQYAFRATRNESYNFRGHGEKYFLGEASRWFFILPSGSVHRWSGSIAASPTVGQVDTSYHADLSTLLNATEPQEVDLDLDFSWSGNELTVDWEDSFTGDFVVTVLASDSSHTTEENFSITVSNSAPVLAPIGDQAVSVSQGFLTIPISTSDADRETIQLDAIVRQADAGSQAAYDLKTQYTMRAARSESYNFRGYREKYFHGNGSQWFFILPSGSVHRWGGSIGGSPHVGDVDTSYYTDLSSLFNLTQPVAMELDVDVTWFGNDLTLDWDDSFAGSFDVTVTASDSIQSTEETFTVTVSNAAPVLSPVADQLLSPGQGSITIPIVASDDDGDALQLDATLHQVDADSVAAFELKTQYDLRAARTDSYNYRGQGEKYFLGEGSRWFFILPDGSVYRWAGSIGGSTPIGQVDPRYHQDLDTLVNATSPTMTALPGNVRWSDNDLVIDLPPDFVGNFTVVVTANDGIDSDEISFDVEVSNHAPVIPYIRDQRFSSPQGSVRFQSFTPTDANGDVVTYRATATTGGAVQAEAYRLKQTFGLYATAESFNYRGYSEKYFRGDGGAWFFILREGDVYRWTGSIASSPQIGQLDSRHYAFLNLLFDATEPTPQPLDGAVTWIDNELIITRPPHITEPFTVTLEASDGFETTTKSITVYLSGYASTKAPASDQATSAQDTQAASIADAVDQVMAQLDDQVNS